MKIKSFAAGAVIVFLVGFGVAATQSCGGGVGVDSDAGPPAPPCTGGTDTDGDKYGPGCPAGDDCDANDSTTHSGAPELCDNKDNNCNGQIDEGARNACGTCDPNCKSFGSGAPFPMDPKSDPNLKDSNGVKLDPKGDLTLDAAMVNFNYLWIANTYDLGGSSVCGKDMTAADAPRCRGTVSKVDTVEMKEVARYFTMTCSTRNAAGGCLDVNGRALTLNHHNTPSRTAVDYNFDVWVANRNVHGGQPSVTKIANDPKECKDRNKSGTIDTSKDQDGDKKINPDCNGDGQFDNAKTVCSNGKPPEFLGDDDECILFTTAYADPDDIGRSVCLDTGKNNVGASNAWVGTFNRPQMSRGTNRFYGIDGNTGAIFTTVNLPPGHNTYGCMADAHHIIWSTDIGNSGASDGKGSLTYFSSMPPYTAATTILRGHSAGQTDYWRDASGEYHQYGISINADQHVWLGGWTSKWVLRYKPDRSAPPASLIKGTWSRFDLPTIGSTQYTRGIAADSRGKIWVSIHGGGYLFRLDQSLPDGINNLTSTKSYWKITADTVIGSGVDFNGNLWGIGHSNDVASRIDVDPKGEVTTTASKDVKLGRNPYTYSDFTGYGLMTFVRPQGRYVYEHSACNGGTVTWNGVSWKATTPAGTAVILRVRTGDSDATFGAWSQEFTASPAVFGPTSKTPIKPNPAKFLQVEFNLKNSTKDSAPVLEEYGIAFSCGGPPA